MAKVTEYSALERLIHRIAFAGPRVQLGVADVEDRMFRDDLTSTTAEHPVFITSLPRAGTTILLTALSEAPELCTHLYRDMPFVMAPMLWERLSGKFRKSADKFERAHGDGIKIGYDSPEAFEEVLWRAFWPKHYASDRILPWLATETDPEATEFFERHFRKIVALRSGRAATGRYLSKNNGNIARLDLIARMFPDAIILVPVRSPLAQATSLLRQHENFTRQHAKDSFIKRYMADIGHYEFGALHRPISFDGFAELKGDLDPSQLDYWLAYWIAAFENVQLSQAHLHLIDYESICADGTAGAAHLCTILDIDPNLAAKIGDHFRPVAPLSQSLNDHRSAQRDQAEALHIRLLKGC